MDDINFDNGVYEVSAPGFGERMARKLRGIGHGLLVVPFFGGVLSVGFTAAASVIAPLSTLFEGGKGSTSRAFKQAVSGAVDSTITVLMSVAPVAWVANTFSAIISGDTVPEHARKITNWMLDGIDGVTRASPSTDYARAMQVLGPNPVAQNAVVGAVAFNTQAQQMAPQAAGPMGPMAQMDAQAGAQMGDMPPGHWEQYVAGQRGQEPLDARRNYLRDGENRTHYQELAAASRAGDIGIGAN